MLRETVKAMLLQYHMIESGQKMAVALSGGRDSVCLLHILKSLQPHFGYELSALHVNHGLRKEAVQEEAFCRRLCQQWNIPLTVYQVDVPARIKSTGESVEEAARSLRYEAFEKAEADRIALAHHQQDQAETLLMHLLRGSALTGLCGMRPVRVPYIRPLLHVSGEQIERYMADHALAHIEDASNQDTAFRRNKIRHELLPLLQQEYNPEIVKILSQTAQVLQEEEAYIEAQLPAVPKGDLSVSWLLSYPENLQKRILKEWLAQNGLQQNVSHTHMQQLIRLLHGGSGKRISLPKGLTVDKSYDILHIYKNIPCEQSEMSMPVFAMRRMPIAEARKSWRKGQNDGIEIPDLPEEKWLNADAFKELPIWRYRRSGDYLMIGGGRKKLKEYLIDEKIPRQERDALPLLAVGAHILWVWGHRISEGAKVTENTQQVLHVRRLSDVSGSDSCDD